MSTFDESRREFLLYLLTTGSYAGLSTNMLIAKQAFAENEDSQSSELIPGRSIYKMEGDVKINGVMATASSVITANDKIETGKNSYIIFVVGKDAFILRSNSNLKLSPENINQPDSPLKNSLVNSLRLVSGKLLSVFGKTEHHITTSNATIGIRGTGVYVETKQEESYVCTCYGTTILTAINDPSSVETITSRHHDAPRYILTTGDEGQLIRPAPFKNHEDIELLLLEELVGRETPFPVPDRRRRSIISPY